MAGQGMVVKGVKGVKYAPMPPEINKKLGKNGWFPAFFGLEITKNAVFCSKVLNKINSQDFLEDTSILKFFIT